MAAATNITKLPEVLRSPTTRQYLPYRHPVKHPNPHFKPRFTFKLEDREHTFLSRNGMRYTDPLMPPYPYGENKHFREANFGLYGGATVQTGNQISKGRNKGKSLRHWFPNVRVETVRSEALNSDLKLPITARVMRTIRKCGGIDEYVTGMKPARIKELGMLGWKLRWLVMTSMTYRAKHARQLQAYNLPKHYSLEGTFEDAWNDDNVRAKMIEQQEAAWQDLRQAAERFEKHVRRNWVESGEKETYYIHKPETLNRSSPSTMNLPERLEEPDIVEEKYRNVRTFEKPIDWERWAFAAARDRLRAPGGVPEQAGISNSGDLSEGLAQEIEGLPMNLKAQDLSEHHTEDDTSSIGKRVAAIGTDTRSQVPEYGEEPLNVEADRETDENAEVLLAKTAEDHVAKADKHSVEHNAEHHLEAVRDEIKRDEEVEARSASREEAARNATEQKSDQKPEHSKR